MGLLSPFYFSCSFMCLLFAILWPSSKVSFNYFLHCHLFPPGQTFLCRAFLRHCLPPSASSTLITLPSSQPHTALFVEKNNTKRALQKSSRNGIWEEAEPWLWWNTWRKAHQPPEFWQWDPELARELAGANHFWQNDLDILNSFLPHSKLHAKSGGGIIGSLTLASCALIIPPKLLDKLPGATFAWQPFCHHPRIHSTL